MRGKLTVLQVAYRILEPANSLLDVTDLASSSAPTGGEAFFYYPIVVCKTPREPFGGAMPRWDDGSSFLVSSEGGLTPVD